MFEKRTLGYIGALAVVSLLFGTIYATVQQNERQSANDPQIQMAEDAAAALSTGEALETVVPGERIDVAKSLATFVEVFDTAGKPVVSSGYLNDAMPTLPAGVFDYVRANGEDRFTWQPERGVRDAAVVTSFNSGFVLVARSIREVEKREDSLLLEVFVAWVLSMAVLGTGIYLLEKEPGE